MVDPHAIEAELRASFKIIGDYDITPGGLVNVKGGVIHMVKQKRLKVKFHEVNGTFMSLWKGLVDLSGLPDHMEKVHVTYYPQQRNLLRLLTAQKDITLQASTYKDYMETNRKRMKIQEILDAHIGQGKAGIMKAAVDLIKAGYGDQAKW
jgi:hypothetical protein